MGWPSGSIDPHKHGCCTHAAAAAASVHASPPVPPTKLCDVLLLRVLSLQSKVLLDMFTAVKAPQASGHGAQAKASQPATRHVHTLLQICGLVPCLTCAACTTTFVLSAAGADGALLRV